MEAGSTEVSRESMEIPPDSISEETFLLTELRYTLGQIQVQMNGLEPDQCNAQGPAGQSIQQLVDELEEQEKQYQQQYSRLLGIQPQEAAVEEGFVGEVEMERLRDQTVAMLLKVPEPWPPEVIELARQQVQNDRRHTTAIAEARIAIFNRPANPKLEEPLTDQVQPGGAQH